MLRDDQLQLLTAAVDGELPLRDAPLLRQLLDESAEAREVYTRLKADSDRLRNLPQAVPPADLHNRIMAALPVTVPAPARLTRPAAHRPAWVPLAVAACLLVGIAASSFWFFARDNAGFAVRSKKPARIPPIGDVLPPDQDPLPSAPLPAGRSDAAVARRNDLPPPREVLPSPEAIPAPREVKDAYAFPPVPPPPPLDLVRVRLPFLVSGTDLEREDVRKQLAEELAHDPAYRIDVFVKDPVRGAELLQAAARAGGVTVHADGTGMDRLRRKQVTAVLVYTEALTPAEVRDLLARVAADDAKAPARVLDAVHVTPLHPPEHRDHHKDFSKDLRDLFGTDPGLWRKVTPPAAPNVPNDTKPITAGTGDMVVKNLTNPPGKPGEKHAVLLPYGPPQARTPPAMSNELKQFLARRGERKPNTVPVVIVIRHTGG